MDFLLHFEDLYVKCTWTWNREKLRSDLHATPARTTRDRDEARGGSRREFDLGPERRRRRVDAEKAKCGRGLAPPVALPPFASSTVVVVPRTGQLGKPNVECLGNPSSPAAHALRCFEIEIRNITRRPALTGAISLPRWHASWCCWRRRSGSRTRSPGAHVRKVRGRRTRLRTRRRRQCKRELSASERRPLPCTDSPHQSAACRAAPRPGATTQQPATTNRPRCSCRQSWETRRPFSLAAAATASSSPSRADLPC